MKKSENFWNRNAKRYDRFMRKDRAAYEKLYELIRPVVKARTVLELAAGTGLIAKNIVRAASHIEVTDASEEMIAEAKRNNRSAKLHFSVWDMFCLPYADKALAEIRRVLKDDGVLIAPTFTHGNGTLRGRIKLFFMKLAGFPLNSRWSSADYLAFLRQNGWSVRKSTMLKASFPLTYAECVKPAVKGRG